LSAISGRKLSVCIVSQVQQQAGITKRCAGRNKQKRNKKSPCQGRQGLFLVTDYKTDCQPPQEPELQEPELQPPPPTGFVEVMEKPER